MASKRLINGGGDQSVDSIFASSSTNSFLGSRAMVSFGGFGGLKGSGSSFFIQDDNVDEYLDEFLNQPEKKRRLRVDQVQFLEKSFEADTKLEPERKIKLARELGLQPRQIGVWFQNRRVRWKTKNLETDYEKLFASYESLKTNYDILLKENEKLKAQVLYVKQNGVSIDMEKANKANISDMISENEESNVLAKGDVIYKDDTEVNNGIHSCLSDSRDISHAAYDSAEIDLAQYREAAYDMNEVFLQTGFVFPKMQDGYCHPPANYCNYGFSDHAFSF